ncbi:hypothetical protein GQ457_09G028280 [Hibiscus cannabinus]
MQVDDSRSALLSSTVNGRPLDALSIVCSDPVLERPGSPLVDDIQRDMKKLKGLESAILTDSSTPMEFDEGHSGKEGPVEIVELSPKHGQDSGKSSVSYASVVGRSLKGDEQGSNGVGLDPNKVIVLDEDCVVNRDGKFPTIRFSNRVYDQIDSAMKNVVIVRLLGRNIGFQTLLNRIHVLWKPYGELQLIDLENNYYLIRVEDPRDYEKILTEGPWTIYGSYLTVQTWSRSFSTSEQYPSHVVVWVRLPGLPYRYYSKALFRRIAVVVGDVVRVDYNTKAGERGKFARLAILVDLNKPLVPCIGIDDFVQKLEYEGLQNVCFKCGIYGHSQDLCSPTVRKPAAAGNTEQLARNINSPVRPETSTESLFGPWMMVDIRRRRALTGRSIPKGVDTEENRDNGSRFAILGKDSGISEMEQVSVAEGDVQQSLQNVQDNPINGRASLEILGTKKSGVSNTVGGSRSVAAGSSAPKKGVAAGAVVLPLMEGRSVSVVEHAGSGVSHSAVSIIEHGHEGRSDDSIVQGKRVGGKAKGVKENVKQGLKIRKSSDVRTISRPVLSEWVDNMNNQLDNLARNRDLDPGGVVRMRVNQEGDLEKSTSLADRDQGLPRLPTDGSEVSDHTMDLGC